jgi:outer membrane protein assembly factor BamB
MKDYSADDRTRFEADVDGKQFGELEFEALLMTVKELTEPVLYGAMEGGSVSSEPIAHGGRVYFGCCDRNFYCLDAGTGEKVWEFKAGRLISLDAAMHCGVIYFSSFDHNLYALTLDGVLVWKFDCGDIPGSVGYHDGTVYVGSRNGNLYAVDSRTGKEVWRFRTSGPVAAQPLVHRGMVLFGSWDHSFYCLDLKGRLKWRFRCGHEAGAATVSGDTVYFGSFDCNIYALSLGGKLRWKYTAKTPIYSTYKPVISGGMLYFGLKDNCIYSIDSSTGKEIWRFATKDMVSMIPLVHGGVLYAGSCDGNMYALDAGTGKEIWRFHTPLALFGPPIIYNRRLYFGGGDSRFYCLTLDGELAWAFTTSMSHPVSIDLGEHSRKRSAEVVWTVPRAREKEGYKSGTFEIADYGDFSGAYIDVSKSSYLGHKKEGYLKQKAF